MFPMLSFMLILELVEPQPVCVSWVSDLAVDWMKTPTMFCTYTLLVNCIELS